MNFWTLSKAARQIRILANICNHNYHLPYPFQPHFHCRMNNQLWHVLQKWYKYLTVYENHRKSLILLKYTDCPATLSTLSEGYYSGVGGPTGQVVVHSGRGRFDIFFKVSWTHLRWWEGVQKSSQKLKNRVFGIFCTPGQMSKSS